MKMLRIIMGLGMVLHEGAAAMAITITDQQKRQYEEDGYTLVRGLIPRPIVDAAKQRIMAVARGAHDWQGGHFHNIDTTRYTWPDGKPMPAGLQLPAKCEKVFDDFARHQNLIDAMEQLLGGDVKLFTDQVGIKYAAIREEQGGCSYYHQDSYYWHIDPSLGCNCWIPTDTVGKDAIALSIMPGSHRDWTLREHEQYYDDPPICSGRDNIPFKRLRIPLDQVDYSNEVLVPMEPGDALFFTNYTWHRSEPNRSGEDKCFYAIAYQLAAVPAAAKA